MENWLQMTRFKINTLRLDGNEINSELFVKLRHGLNVCALREVVE